MSITTLRAYAHRLGAHRAWPPHIPEMAPVSASVVLWFCMDVTFVLTPRPQFFKSERGTQLLEVSDNCIFENVHLKMKINYIWFAFDKE